MRRLSACLLIALALVAAAPAESSGRSRTAPPRVELGLGHQHRTLGPWSYQWSAQTGPGECVGSAADGFPRYDASPPAAPRGTERGRLIFHSPRRPARVILRWHTRLEDGKPAGPAHRSPVSLRSIRREGTVRRWVGIFPLRADRTYYFDLHLVYEGRGPCSAGGDASYAFSLRTQGG